MCLSTELLTEPGAVRAWLPVHLTDAVAHQALGLTFKVSFYLLKNSGRLITACFINERN